MKKNLLIALGVLFLVFISVSVQANLYSQQPLFTDEFPTAHVSSIRLDPSTSDKGAWAADDFTLSLQDPGISGSMSISTITWWGFSTLNETTTFRFTFYADNGSYPGGFLQVSTASSNRLAAGDYGLYKYSSTLSTPFIADANTKYWLSIYDTTPSVSWGWVEAEKYINGAFQEVFYVVNGIPNGHYRTNYPDDLAFELTYQAVPIPSAAWLLASGLIGLVVIRRRLRK